METSTEGIQRVSHVSADISQMIEQRCHELGLTLEQAQRLAVENDRSDPNSLYRLLCLEFDTLEPVKTRNPKKWLWMAANTSNVSYRSQLTEDELKMILLTGQVPNNRIANALHLLDEAPMVMIIMAAHEVAMTSQRPANEIVANVGQIAEKMHCKRWQTLAG
ncbi:hypothetical protein H8K38_06225 [Undibacterium sp. FT79W]|uniref:hypothetical protein n=1 Tax=Undibacterium sp. FT79W TaxID=2762296 RepID=UPI00164C7A6C|nr:hypothetical protein [Undibacterium sp. FT79W]MBC3877396.1 hypothetical protein [Undibacterium sp. FT79W]